MYRGSRVANSNTVSVFFCSHCVEEEEGVIVLAMTNNPQFHSLTLLFGCQRVFLRNMDGWMDEWMDEEMDGEMDGWMDGWMGGRADDVAG